MKKSFGILFSRIGNLIMKLISVKGILTGCAFIAYLKSPTEWSFWLMIVFGGLFVIGREWGKYIEVLKIIKKVD